MSARGNPSAVLSADLAIDWDDNSSVQDRVAQRIACAMMAPQFDAIEPRRRKGSDDPRHPIRGRAIASDAAPVPIIPWQAGYRCQICGAHVVTTGRRNTCTGAPRHKVVPPSKRELDWGRCKRCGRYTEDPVPCCPPLHHHCVACGAWTVGRHLLCSACGCDWPVEVDE